MKHQIVNELLIASLKTQNKLNSIILQDEFAKQVKSYTLEFRRNLLSKQFTSFVNDNPTYNTLTPRLHEYLCQIESCLNAPCIDVNKYTNDIDLYINRIIVELSYILWHIASNEVSRYFE